MVGKRVSRRTFLKIAAIGGVASVSSGLAVDGEAWAHGSRRDKDKRPRHEHKSKLNKAIEKVLGRGVQGMERNNQIASRLATNLARIGGPSREITDQRRELLFRAARDVEKHQEQKSHGGRRTVTENLNDLLDAVRAQRADPGFTRSLLKASIVTVLFAAHGSHFPETSAAHSQFRLALLALKNRRSEVPFETRAAAKRRTLAIYRATIAARRRQMTPDGHFPGEASLRSVWIMPRSMEV